MIIHSDNEKLLGGLMHDSKLKSSVMLRMIITMVVALLLLIPAMFIESLINEREQRRNEAVKEVSEKWGYAQTITGPVLTIPYTVRDAKGQPSVNVEQLQVLPDDLKVDAALDPQIRYRGIYEVVLYGSAVKIKGLFSLPRFEERKILPQDILWKDAFITVGLTNLKGIRNTIFMDWNGQKLQAQPGVKATNIVTSGFTFLPSFESSKQQYAFSMDINLNGSDEFSMVPVGKETGLTVKSSWGNPSFIGNFLPEKRQVTKSGFFANWKIQELNRNFPQTWANHEYKLEDSKFGVKLLLPVDQYQKITRSVKYALMFIALTFLAFFLSEMFSGTAIHPIQYVLIGLAMTLFYVLLLSMSEHISFNVSYAIASIAVIGLVTGYARAVLKLFKATALIGSVLTALYIFLFVTLQLEDYALLMGSVGLFIILSIVMFLTRGINWFSMGRQNVEKKTNMEINRLDL